MSSLATTLSTNKDKPRRRISIIGATGSIGKQTLDLVRANPDRYDVIALTANHNIDALIAMAKEFKPRYVATAKNTHQAVLSNALEGYGIEYNCGAEAIIEAARYPADYIMSAIVGAAGLLPTMEALRQKDAIVALANKESLVCAGELVMDASHSHGTTILPVDSEHNALFQVLQTDMQHAIEKVTLTASGGPFLKTAMADIKNITPVQAVAHPNWDMGAKISVDSATMMNKGLEVIEAKYLFALEPQQIDVLVHPESTIHGMVHYSDGSVLAQLGTPDMHTPIAHTLAWPKRMHVKSNRLDLAALARLHFYTPDKKKFPALAIARTALADGMAACCALNAANEVAVEAFLQEKISFLAITNTIETILTKIALKPINSIEDVIAWDAEIRLKTKELIT